ncbi:MAG: type II secretion system F family protein [bacterium]
MLKDTEKLNFLMVFRTLIESGIPLGYSLDICIQTFKKYEKELSILKRLVTTGSTLSNAFQKSKILDGIELSILKIGEQAENLPYVLKKIESILQRKIQTKNNLLKSLIYPSLFLLVISIILLIFKNLIIPSFRSLYADLGIPEPLAFKLLSILTSIFDLKILLLLFIISLTVYFILRNMLVFNKKEIYSYVFKIPILGNAIYNSYLSLVLNLWAISLESGINFLNTFLILKNETVEPFATFFSKLHDKAKRGELIEILNYNNAFKPMYIKQINSGLESGELPKTLKKLAELADLEANTSLDTINKLLEPIMSALAGIIAAVIALSIFSPIMFLVKNL